jgi:hypothetical protein
VERTAGGEEGRLRIHGHDGPRSDLHLVNSFDDFAQEQHAGSVGAWRKDREHGMAIDTRPLVGRIVARARQGFAKRRTRLRFRVVARGHRRQKFSGVALG